MSSIATGVTLGVEDVGHAGLHQTLHQLLPKCFGPLRELEGGQGLIGPDGSGDGLLRPLRFFDLVHQAVDSRLQRLVHHQGRALPRVHDLVDGEQLLQHHPALQGPRMELVGQPLAGLVAAVGVAIGVVRIHEGGVVSSGVVAGGVVSAATEPVSERGGHRHHLASGGACCGIAACSRGARTRVARALMRVDSPAPALRLRSRHGHPRAS